VKKPRGDAKLKTLPDALQEALWQFLRQTTAEKAAAWLMAEHGVKTSTGALSEFFAWYPRTGWLKQSAAFASDLEATIKKLPELRISAEQASQVAQVSFEIQAAQNRDPELYGMLGRAALEKRRLELDQAKFAESKKKDWEKGLDALQDEIKGNAEAMKHFEALTAVLKKANS
jgi:hypothetical protein